MKMTYKLIIFILILLLGK